MKTIKLLSIFIFLYGTVSAQQGSADIDLEKYLNKNVEYCDHVHGTYVTQGKNKVILLNLGAKYPDHRLVVAIFESDWKNFKYEPAVHLNHKDICVKGKIILYNSKTEKIMKMPDQHLIKPK